MKFTKYKKDSFLVFILTLLTSFIFLYLDLFDSIIEFTEQYEEYEVDEIFLTLLVLPFYLIWFVGRRLKEINFLNKNLEEKVKEELEKRLQNERLLVSQSKNAELGEMMSLITHQWKQPLSVIKLVSTATTLMTESKGFNEIKLKTNMKNINSQVDYLSDTIDTFKNYFKNNNNLFRDDIRKTVQNTLKLLHATLKYHNIIINHNIDSIDLCEIETYHNELQQILINILNNSRDALEEKNIENKKIDINIKIDNDIVSIIIVDNAGGVPDEILNNICDKYFTTKENTNGTGLGLFMVKDIVENKLQGKVSMRNTSNGLETTISIKSINS